MVVAVSCKKKNTQGFSWSFISWRDFSESKRCLQPCGSGHLRHRSGTSWYSIACDSAIGTLSLKRTFSVILVAQPWSCCVASRTWCPRALTCAACGLARLCCLPSPALDLLFLSNSKLLKLIRRTWSLRSTCFACLQPGRASWPFAYSPPNPDTPRWKKVCFGLQRLLCASAPLHSSSILLRWSSTVWTWLVLR